ncbi:hypothetical protein [Paraliomyxa miuraensis]|uniref:hypothetical protein n=1 Tax=Paraliomyxa miuraensis TaxID=376150 RepID=UPI00224E5607|nr:hypothetical protein [Paraliomyxa miuraensis]MCX4244981.1 hypothetical protein [Paraliomyxa miuraensis]
MLAQFATGSSDVESVLRRARDHELPALALAVTHYPDRFVIVLRAAFMATVNFELDPREQQLFEDLVELMALTREDRELIREEASKLAVGEPGPVHPRVALMQRESSLSPAVERLGRER